MHVKAGQPCRQSQLSDSAELQLDAMQPARMPGAPCNCARHSSPACRQRYLCDTATLLKAANGLQRVKGTHSVDAGEGRLRQEDLLVGRRRAEGKSHAGARFQRAAAVASDGNRQAG